MGKITRRGLVKKVDKIWSLYIRKRDKKCIVCGSKNYLQCGHLFSRNSYSTRWDEYNCNAQCASCNWKHEADAYPYEQAFKKRFGEKQYHITHKKYLGTIHLTDSDLMKMYEKFKQMLEELK